MAAIATAIALARRSLGTDSELSALIGEFASAPFSGTLRCA